MKLKCDQLEKYNNDLTAEVENMKLECAMKEIKRRKNNIVIHGVPSLQNENPQQLVSHVEKYLSTTLKSNISMKTAYRMGKNKNGEGCTNIPIIATLDGDSIKNKIYKNASKLAGTKIKIQDIYILLDLLNLRRLMILQIPPML